MTDEGRGHESQLPIVSTFTPNPLRTGLLQYFPEREEEEPLSPLLGQVYMRSTEGEEKGKKKGEEKEEAMGRDDKETTPHLSLKVGRDGTVQVQMERNWPMHSGIQSRIGEEFHEAVVHQEKKLKERRIMRIVSELEVLAEKFKNVGSTENVGKINKTIVNVLCSESYL